MLVGTMHWLFVVMLLSWQEQLLSQQLWSGRISQESPEWD